MPELWLPGGAGGSVEELIERLHRQIAEFGKSTVVELELRDGSVFVLEAIKAEPGLGFVTLCPHPEEGDPRREVVVPVGAIARITLGPPEQRPGFGFSVPPPA